MSTSQNFANLRFRLQIRIFDSVSDGSGQTFRPLKIEITFFLTFFGFSDSVSSQKKVFAAKSYRDYKIYNFGQKSAVDSGSPLQKPKLLGKAPARATTLFWNSPS